ncbi:hypothetical protein vBPpSSYP_70 [Pseudomonas phage vB_PpS_SYP]|nr:hypothetical protein vBPpSSYP_70 [Pseudomonas phage vB_PpS_SYP]
MIVTGVKKQEVEIDVDPQQFIIDLHEMWLISRRLPITAYLRSGHWYMNERLPYGIDEVPLRAADEQEVMQFEALLIVQNIASELD